ncbi:acid-resistance membrane protein [Roseimaritima multifibrata]|uniref:Acid-resistance membrane protein n=1 Tax=Roseimaritima multifibrata TaxID=1930274 RepID=A0A517MGV7_9BACT|nr:HdeD family acid-resistance protein [Roseimaritima multifibrata]QDS94120.1 acid-resistance membrane protein [Roseimaritima multifibrata]
MNNKDSRLSRIWWLFATRGVFALLFGLAAIFWPGMTISILVAVFGAFVLLDGLMMLAVGIQSRQTNPRWSSLALQGVLNVAIGLVAFFAPIATAMAVVILIASWAIVMGVLEIFIAIRMRRTIQHEWLLVVGGVISILLGGSLFMAPGAGILVMAWIIGGFSILSGFVLLSIAMRLKKVKSTVLEAEMHAVNPSSERTSE